MKKKKLNGDEKALPSLSANGSQVTSNNKLLNYPQNDQNKKSR